MGEAAGSLSGPFHAFNDIDLRRDVHVEPGRASPDDLQLSARSSNLTEPECNSPIPQYAAGAGKPTSRARNTVRPRNLRSRGTSLLAELERR